LGFEWKEVGKGVYIDGNEQPDVDIYREQSFLPKWKELEPQMPKWSSLGQVDEAPLPVGEHLLIPCAHV